MHLKALLCLTGILHWFVFMLSRCSWLYELQREKCACFRNHPLFCFWMALFVCVLVFQEYLVWETSPGSSQRFDPSSPPLQLHWSILVGGTKLGSSLNTTGMCGERRPLWGRLCSNSDELAISIKLLITVRAVRGQQHWACVLFFFCPMWLYCKGVDLI